MIYKLLVDNVLVRLYIYLMNTTKKIITNIQEEVNCEVKARITKELVNDLKEVLPAPMGFKEAMSIIKNTKGYLII